MIRVISGVFKGRRIQAPKNLPVRPTTDRAKEGLFNILANRFDFSEVKALDLFAGTGNLSYELASRSCESVVAVDSNRRCTEFINQTALKIGASAITTLRASATDFLSGTYLKFDLILADPPYDYEDYEELVERVFDREVLTAHGILIIEHDSKMALDELPNFRENRRYGNSSFSFFGASN